MGMLANGKHEIFAQQIAKGSNQFQAALLAGFSERSASALASRLVRKPLIQARVKELRNRGDDLAACATGLSKAWVLNELSYVVACNRGKPGCVKPLELIGRELGMFQDMIPRQVFDIIMFRMGETVLKFVEDPTTLERITSGWSMIKEQHPLTRGATIETEAKPVTTEANAVDSAVEPEVTPTESDSDG